MPREVRRRHRQAAPEVVALRHRRRLRHRRDRHPDHRPCDPVIRRWPDRDPLLRGHRTGVVRPPRLTANLFNLIYR